LKNEGETIPASPASPNKKADMLWASQDLTSDATDKSIFTTTRSEISLQTAEMHHPHIYRQVNRKLSAHIGTRKADHKLLTVKLRCAKKG